LTCSVGKRILTSVCYIFHDISFKIAPYQKAEKVAYNVS